MAATDCFCWLSEEVMFEALVSMADASVCSLIKFVGFNMKLFSSVGKVSPSIA